MSELGQPLKAPPLGLADVRTNILLRAADAVAQADIPTDVAEAHMSARMVALLKPDGAFHGISSRRTPSLIRLGLPLSTHVPRFISLYRRALAVTPSATPS